VLFLVNKIAIAYINSTPLNAVIGLPGITRPANYSKKYPEQPASGSHPINMMNQITNFRRPEYHEYK
jgi:hypothetical protein